MNLTFVPCKTEPTFVFALIQRSKEREKEKEEEEKVESVKLLEARSRTHDYIGFSLSSSFSLLFSRREADLLRDRGKNGGKQSGRKERKSE